MLPGLEVRTRSGEYLGKVRDFSFSPDNGALARIIYDDFGLAFLPSAFFDTFSLTIGDVVNVGVGGLVVSDQARYNEQRESSGVFAAIPSLLRTLTTGSTRTVAALTDGYRGGEAGSSVAGYLPQGYSFEQWEADT
ncbi:PRC domain-containing protein, partial [Haematococcus lacustris]